MNDYARKICAEHCASVMGLKFRGDGMLDDALMSMTRSYADPSSPKYEFTEQYFYHEFLFHHFSAIEMEVAFGFVTKVIKTTEIDLGPLNLTPSSVVEEMRNYAYLIPVTRMRAAGISPSMSDQFGDWLQSALNDYRCRQSAAVSSGIFAVPKAAEHAIGLAPRTTKYHEYLGAFADNMLDAVGATEDPLFSTLFETMLLAKRAVFFRVLPETLNEGLRRVSAE